jgi:hypothetical protein
MSVIRLQSGEAMSTTLERLATQQQDDFLAITDALEKELVDTYRGVAARLGKEMTHVLSQISEAKANGERVSEAWLGRQRWLLSMEQQVIAELEQYGVFVEHGVTVAQHTAVVMGEQYAQELMRAGMGSSIGVNFHGLSFSATEHFVGRTQHDGQLLEKALSKYPKQAADAIKRELATSITLRNSPRKTARILSQAIGGASGDYLMLAATETLNAHRAGAIASYKQNQDVVSEWEWMLGKGDACSICQGKAGQRYSLDTPFDEHPRGKCTPIPVMKGENA